MLLSLPACSLISDKTDDCCTLSIRAKVAEETGTVYMSGNIDALGPWRPDGLALRGEGLWRSVSIDVPRGTVLEYKFTLGTWDREALGPSGTVMPNFKLLLDQDKAVDHVLDRWRADPREYMADWRGSGVQGTLVYWQDMASDFLDLSRHVVIWLPPGYDPGREEGYPVLYMHDGQNLFGPNALFGGWRVAATLDRLKSERAGEHIDVARQPVRDRSDIDSEHEQTVVGRRATGQPGRPTATTFDQFTFPTFTSVPVLGE